MKNMDKGTVIRTVLLFIALVNQVFGFGTIALDEGQVVTIVEGLYLLGSTLFTIITALFAWFKNNYVTDKGKEQKKVLQAKGLINSKFNSAKAFEDDGK
ncbi:phage holin [Cytobacillus firmus]|uniref:phage holin n=1 Tax=Cytobacillus firmus TaxID=1399 RepID=UPI002079CF39|nr:phage holin [Cytobacillus firmus]USK40180.1 phage holin [Cytobacillus firmus]